MISGLLAIALAAAPQTGSRSPRPSVAYDVLEAVNHSVITTFADLQRVLRTLRVGDTAVVDVQRDGRQIRVSVPVAGYVTPRVRFTELANVSEKQRATRARWLAGW